MAESTTRFAISCCGCGQILQIRHEVLGRKAKCPNCHTVFRAPLDAPEVTVALPAPGPQTAGMQAVGQLPTPGIGGHAPDPGEVSPARGPAGTKRCDQCHQFVSINRFDEHYRQHMEKREDGQLNSYPAIPPEQRWRGDIASVPQFYEHEKCGSITGMPETIMRTYLVNPFFYASKTYCGGCQGHVPHRQLRWVTTGEDLQAYFDRLKKTVPHAGFYRRKAVKSIITAGSVIAIMAGLVIGGIGFFLLDWRIALALLLGISLLGTPLCCLMLLKVRGGL